MENSVHGFQRVGYALGAFTGLAAIYLFQYTDFLLLLSGHRFSPEYHFISNRMVRIFINDSCMLALIYAIFRDPAIVKLAFYIQLIDLFVLFPLYLSLKIPFEGISEISSPFLSQLHRLIVNPTLILLLIAGIYYQKLVTKHDN
jgi:exosortase F-associated protein